MMTEEGGASFKSVFSDSWRPTQGSKAAVLLLQPTRSRAVCPSTWPTCRLGEEILLAQGQGLLEVSGLPVSWRGLAPGWRGSVPRLSPTRLLRLKNCCWRALRSCLLAGSSGPSLARRQVVTLGRHGGSHGLPASASLLASQLSAHRPPGAGLGSGPIMMTSPSTCCCLASSSWAAPGLPSAKRGGKGGGVRRWAENDHPLDEGAEIAP